jgi:hypothetical protein
VCVRKCAVRCLLSCEKRLSQPPHEVQAYGRSPVCLRKHGHNSLQLSIALRTAEVEDIKEEWEQRLPWKKRGDVNNYPAIFLAYNYIMSLKRHWRNTAGGRPMAFQDNEMCSCCSCCSCFCPRFC